MRGAHPLTGRQVVHSAEIFTDLNPIEQVFAKLKRLLRKATAVEAVGDGISCSQPSYQRNAPTISKKLDTPQPKFIPL